MTTAVATASSESTESHQGVTVGDFFYSSWGYDQTNCSFFKVIGFTKSGKSVKIQEWTSKLVGSAGGPQETVVPGNGPVTGAWVRCADGAGREYDPTVKAPIETKLIKSYGGRAVLAWTSFASLYHWDGKPKWITGSGYGH